MKKEMRIAKIISAILIALMVLNIISNIALASNTTGDPLDIGSKITEIGKGNNTDTTKISTIGKTIVTIMQVIGVVVAIVILLVLGIKYMVGSAEEKAEYKKTMMPYVIGAFMIFGATTIVNVLYSVISGANNQLQ